jgi:hypothetical protein
MKRLLACCAAWIIALVPGASPVRADVLVFGYQWQLGPGQGPTFPSNSSNVALSVAPAGTFPGVQGVFTIPVASITASSSSLTTDSFHQPYDLTLRLTDLPDHTSATLTWNGLIAGNVGPNSSTLANSLTSSPTQATSLNGYTFSATIEPNPLPIPPPGSNSPAAVEAVVSIAPELVFPATVPEPSAVLLAASSLACAAAARVWRRARASS